MSDGKTVALQYKLDDTLEELNKYTNIAFELAGQIAKNCTYLIETGEDLRVCIFCDASRAVSAEAHRLKLEEHVGFVKHTEDCPVHLALKVLSYE